MSALRSTKPLLLATTHRPWLLLRPKRLTTPLLNTTITTATARRCIHTAPNKQYNGIQTAAHHFKQQRHMPYFLEYLMWAVFGSEALHLIWLKMDYKDYRERTAHKKKVLEELIERIEQGENITDSLKDEIRMVLMNKHDKQHKLAADDFDDEYLNKLIEQSKNERGSFTTNGNNSDYLHRDQQKEESKWIDEEKVLQGADKKPSSEKAFFL